MKQPALFLLKLFSLTPLIKPPLGMIVQILFCSEHSEQAIPLYCVTPGFITQ